MKEFYHTKYEGYMVSKEGVIASFRKSASKSTPNKRVDYTRKPKFLSYKVDKDGYFEVLLSVNKQKYYKKVHQVVAEVFLGEKPEGCVVDHINRDRQDNRVENLRWLPLSKNSDGQRGKKTSSCKHCVCNGKIYGSILDACKDNNISYTKVCHYPEQYRRTILIEGVETIEILTGK